MARRACPFASSSAAADSSARAFSQSTSTRAAFAFNASSASVMLPGFAVGLAAAGASAFFGMLDDAFGGRALESESFRASALDRKGFGAVAAGALNGAVPGGATVAAEASNGAVAGGSVADNAVSAVTVDSSAMAGRTVLALDVPAAVLATWNRPIFGS